MLLSINMTTHTLSPTPRPLIDIYTQLPARCLPPFSIFLSRPSYSSSLPGEPQCASRQSQCLSLVSLVLPISSTPLPFLTVVFCAHLRCIRVENKVELKWQQPCFSRDLGSKKGADLFERLLAKKNVRLWFLNSTWMPFPLVCIMMAMDHIIVFVLL